MPLAFQVTAAGRAALVNAANTGTLPVLITQVGVTATAFTAAADGSDLALPGELKRLATFGGAAVADDTIHAVIRDDSADIYTLRGFSLYLGDGTLFGLYGQADPILEKSAGAMMLLATDVIFADIDAASLTFGDASFLNPPATTETAGVVELATDAEAVAGVDAVRAVTPKGLLAKLTALLGAGAPSAFVKTLLTAVDLVAFRTLLAIKTAASYDIGVGNGLDADLLDGQHGAYYRAWGNLTGVPATFPPATHVHTWDQVTGKPETATRWATWGEVSDKPATFPPAPHSQDWSTITGKPATYPPSIHGHAINDVVGLTDALDEKAPSTGPVFSNGQPAASASSAAVMGGGGLATAIRFLPRASVGAFNSLVQVNDAALIFDAASNGYGIVIGPVTAVAGGLGLRISGNGNVNVSGAIAATGDVTANQNITSATANLVLAPTGAGNIFLRPNGKASGVGEAKIDAAGNLTVTGSIAPAGGYDYGSSLKLKSDTPLQPMPYGLAEIEQIQTYRGRYNDDYCSDGRDRLFVLIEQVGKLIPEAEKKGAIDYRGEKVSAAQFDQLWPVAIKAMQELSAQVRELRAEVTALKASR